MYFTPWGLLKQGRAGRVGISGKPKKKGAGGQGPGAGER